MKLIVFDLDRTLAPIDEAALPQTLETLRCLESRGVTIAVCSGKSTPYLCGFMRQSGLRRPVLMGELGATVQFGVQLPPARFSRMPYPAQTRTLISALRERMEQEDPDGIWFPDHSVVLTPFPKAEKDFAVIRRILREMLPDPSPVQVFENPESFDIVPAGIDKGAALVYLCGLLGIDPSEAAAVGDGVNDYPMFRTAGTSIGIALRDQTRADHVFPDIAGALAYLLSLT